MRIRHLVGLAAVVIATAFFRDELAKQLRRYGWL
jgi:hypothetical protein